MFDFYSKKKLYPSLQIVGWGLMFLHQVIVSVLILEKLDVKRTGIIFVSIIFAVFLTHVYRLGIKKQSFFAFHLRKQILIFAISVAVLSLLASIFSYTISLLLVKKVVSFWDIRLWSIYANWAVMFSAWLLAYFLYQYFDFWKKQNTILWQHTQALAQTEQEIIRLQFNPHFLFNALNAIRSLLLSDVPKAQKAYHLLGNLIMNSYFKMGFEKITIQQEMRIVEEYITLEQIRFEDRFSFAYHISENLQKKFIPAGTILTLVENAVKHGVSKTREQGFVQVNISDSDQKVQIVVSNTGKLSTEKTQNYLGGIGLANIKKRLELYFYKNFSLEMMQSEQNVVKSVLSF